MRVSPGLYMTLFSTIDALGKFYCLLIFVWALFSWFNHSKGTLRSIYTILDKLVGPFVKLFRRFLPSFGGMDFSPLIAIIVVQVVVQALLWLIRTVCIPF